MSPISCTETMADNHRRAAIGRSAALRYVRLFGMHITATSQLRHDVNKYLLAYVIIIIVVFIISFVSTYINDQQALQLFRVQVELKMSANKNVFKCNIV